jgi:hypothetical protein
MAFSISSVLGVNLGNNDTTPVFTVGTIIDLNDGGQAMYVQALSETAQYNAVLVNDSNKCAPLTTTNSATCKRFAVAHDVSIVSATYGWVRLGGVVKIALAANCASSVPLYTTATGGVLDDATVSGGVVFGVVSTTSISNATAATCIMGYPHVGSGNPVTA